MTDTVPSPLLARRRVGAIDIVLVLAAISAYFVFPGYLSLGTAALIMALFALSLDIAMGYAGILTLGHALFFGIGAYGAGLIAIAGLHEAITGAILAGVIAAFTALIVGPFILRLSGLPLIMVTLALGVIAYEAANKMTWLTGGDNGLQGIEIAPLLGMFRWSVYGQTAYLYALAWLIVLFWAARRIVASPFGVALQGIRENRQRMAFMGAPVLGHLVRAYVISAFMAGVAGAISAQTTNFVGLQVLSLDNSADVVVMLVLGGVGRLYGGLIGAPVFVIAKDLASEWNPYHWMFVIGGLLIVVVRFAKGGFLGMVEAATQRLVTVRSRFAR